MEISGDFPSARSSTIDRVKSGSKLEIIHSVWLSNEIIRPRWGFNRTIRKIRVCTFDLSKQIGCIWNLKFSLHLYLLRVSFSRIENARRIFLKTRKGRVRTDCRSKLKTKTCVTVCYYARIEKLRPILTDMSFIKRVCELRNVFWPHWRHHLLTVWCIWVN